MTTPPLLTAVQPDLSALRRMKRTATGLLLATGVVFLVAVALPGGAVRDLVLAASEAGLVGGLADWFAVTALFRHPLGLRVPHTALIPRKKDELAARLGEFVTGNFFTADAVAQQVVEVRVVHRAAVQLADPATARAVSREVAAAVTAGLDVLDERRLTGYVLELARRDLARRSYAPVLGQFLARAVEGGAQTPLVDVAVVRLRAYLLEHRDELRPQIILFLEEQGVLGWLVATDNRVDRFLTVAATTLGEVEQDPSHPLRRWVDGLLESVVDDLRYNAATAARVDAQLRALADDPHLMALVHAVLVDVLQSLRASLTDVDGDLADRLAELVAAGATRVVDDPDLERRLEERLLGAVRYAVDHYASGAAALIQRTVEGWEGRDAADRLEASVGRDLQFIRINGTVVGALAGVVLHLVAVLLG